MRRPLEFIAFWQSMAFLMLIALVWASPALDLPNLLYGTEPGRFDWVGASVLTAGVIVVAFITIGHAYVQQRRALRELITVCSYCRRVRVEEAVWSQMEVYFARQTRAEFTHGVCPTCYEEVMRRLADPSKTPEQGPSVS